MAVGEHAHRRSHQLGVAGHSIPEVGEVPGRGSPEERVFFSPIGMGTEDVCVCYKVYRLALEKGIGTKLRLFGRDG